MHLQLDKPHEVIGGQVAERASGKAEGGTAMTVAFDKVRDEKVLQQSYNLYRTRHGLLTGSEMKELRERYGLSQRALAGLARALRRSVHPVFRREQVANLRLTWPLVPRRCREASLPMKS